MSSAWKLMSDKHFKQILVSQPDLDQETLRLVLLALFYKIKRLEEQVFAMQSLAMAKDLYDDEELKHLLDRSRSYLEKKDDRNYQQVEFWKGMGISFEEMVQFLVTGNFEKDKDNNP